MKTKTMMAGILEPVFAIRTGEDLGVGDTEGVRQMIDWCARHHLNIFQTLPINETGADNSPYVAISSLAIEPSTLALSPRHLPDLTPAAFNKLARPALLAKLRRGPVNYPKVKALKRALLEAAFDHFWKTHWRKKSARAGQLRHFLSQNAGWLEPYALFRVLMEENGGDSDWESWPREHGAPEQARAWLRSLTKTRRESLERRQLFFSYIQWIAFGQWEALKKYAGERNVLLMGDIPFGVGRRGADTWASRAIFDLDWSGGAPPEKAFKVDEFTRKWGQNWGIPRYRWDVLRGRGFDWWRTRIDNIRRNFHLYRIDHALGFFRVYSFPWKPGRNAEFTAFTRAEAAAKTGGRLPRFMEFPDDTPAHAAFNRRQGAELLRFVQEASGATGIVAEDLGMVPDYVPAALRRLGIPGFRIPLFTRERGGSYSDPARYPRLSLTQPATHDHPPLAAAWAECWRNIDAGRNAAANRRELRHVMRFAGVGGERIPRQFNAALREGYLRRVAQSNSQFAVVMITDVFGEAARFNTPGAAGGRNWTTRMKQTVAELESNPAMLAKARTFSRLMREAGRGVASGREESQC
ncbi:MAG TPA: 4-alpha-glucanotransferase [Verrucomicrobiae bacterium]|jgi:4-alpha-glucanotransferase